MEIRSHIRELQQLENKAAERAGLKMLMLDENRLMGKKSNEYIETFIEELIIINFGYMKKASELGERLNGQILEGK